MATYFRFPKRKLLFAAMLGTGVSSSSWRFSSSSHSPLLQCFRPDTAALWPSELLSCTRSLRESVVTCRPNVLANGQHKLGVEHDAGDPFPWSHVGHVFVPQHGRRYPLVDRCASLRRSRKFCLPSTSSSRFLNVVGGIIGKNSAGNFDAPCHKVPRQIPHAPWYMSRLFRSSLQASCHSPPSSVELHHICEHLGTQNLRSLASFFLAFTMLLIVTSFRHCVYHLLSAGQGGS